ncbi:hypothetical protein GG344DRAFT_81238 [Lentinula edodes]|nr:hypothetical protein GG344DRAFT_81238 [Lentinula edodes]
MVLDNSSTNSTQLFIRAISPVTETIGDGRPSAFLPALCILKSYLPPTEQRQDFMQQSHDNTIIDTACNHERNFSPAGDTSHSAGVLRLPRILPLEKQLVTTSAVKLASASRRKKEAKFFCPVPGCDTTFTRRDNLNGQSTFFDIRFARHWF